MNTAASSVVIAGIVVLIGAFIVGAALFTPGRAKAVMRAEALSRKQVAQLATDFRSRHPELRTSERLDRHDCYVWLHLGLWCVGWGVILAPAPAGALTALSWDAQKLLGLCILTGSTVALIGLSLGLRVGQRILARPIVDNLLSDLLGDDIRIPYGLGALGLLSVGISMCGYGWTIYQYSTLIGTLGGGLTFAIGGMCLTLSRKFVKRILHYTRQRNLLLTEISEQIPKVRIVNGSTWIALGSLLATFITAGGGAAIVVHTIRSNRNKPALDASNTQVAESTVKRMVDDSNAFRDTRLWQLEGYVNLDLGWHFDVMAQYRIQNATLKRLIELIREAGIDLGDIALPADDLPQPPPVPEPPRRG